MTMRSDSATSAPQGARVASPRHQVPATRQPQATITPEAVRHVMDLHQTTNTGTVPQFPVPHRTGE